MKKLITAFAAVAALQTPLVSAIDFAIQPRLEIGAMYYEYEQEDRAEIRATGNPVDGLPNSTVTTTAQNGLNFKDTLPFISGGITLFVDKFFVDLSAQYADNGSDNADNRSSQVSTQNGQFSDNALQFASNNADFDRTDFSISVGYAITKNFAVYAGYKSAETDFKIKRNGVLRTDRCSVNNTCVSTTGTFTANTNLKFELDGPFVGGTYGWELGKGALSGTLAGNFAVAFLDADTKETTTNIILTPVTPSGNRSQLPNQSAKISGDTVGLSLGALWYGSTPINSLSYVVGVDGYNYSFSGDTADFEETIVRFKVGAAYAF